MDHYWLQTGRKPSDIASSMLSAAPSIVGSTPSATPSIASSATSLLDHHNWANSSPWPSIIAEKMEITIPKEVSSALNAKGLDVDCNGVVRWKPNSHTHPRQWSLRRKLYDSALICFLEFFMTLVSNTGSSIATGAATEFGISTELSIFCIVTVYLIGQALGGLLFPPVAESFGGRTIYVVSTFTFAVACLVIAAAPTLPTVVVGRFVSGFASGVPAVVASGSIENMWNTKARIWVIHTWICSAVLGLCLGPPIATYVGSSALGWPWVYVIAAIVTGLCGFLCFGMLESRPSEALRQHVQEIARDTNFSNLSTDSSDALPTLSIFVRTTLWEPIRLFLTEPIVFLVALMAATVYGVVYLFSEALTVVYVDGFDIDARPASLINLALAVGIVFTFLPRIYDVYFTNRRTHGGLALEPEALLFGFYVAAPIFAVGLWWFALTVPPLGAVITPWASIASLVLVGYGVVEFDNTLSSYIVETYASHAASASASVGLLRAILSGGFPLIGRQMFHTLGSNNAVFILAGVATGFCGVAALFGVYGGRIRKRSAIAEKTWLALQSDSEQSLPCTRGEV